MPSRGTKNNTFRICLMIFSLAIFLLVPVSTNAQEVKNFTELKDKVLVKITPQISWVEKNVIEPVDNFRVKKISIIKEWNEKQKNNLEEIRKKTEAEKEKIDTNKNNNPEKEIKDIINYAKDFPLIPVTSVFAGEALLFFLSHKIIFFTLCVVIAMTIIKIILKKMVKIFNTITKKGY